MTRRRRRLRLVVGLLIGVVALSYITPLLFSESMEFSLEPPVKTVGPSVDLSHRVATTGSPNTAMRTKLTRVNGTTKLNDGGGILQNVQQVNDSPSRTRHNQIPFQPKESEGFNLSSRVWSSCVNRGGQAFMPHWKSVRLHANFASKDERVQLCPVWKAGTTFLRRLFLMTLNSTFSNLTNPYDISYAVRYYMKSNIIFSSDITKRFIFVREPYERIFSSYIDKLLAPNPYYWSAIGTRAIYLLRGALAPSRRCGHDLTFKEYIKYIIHAIGLRSTGSQTDPHFLPVEELCRPCIVNYHFVGKMETFKQDYPVLIRELNLTYTDEILETLARNGDELAAIDAIEDSTNQPFDPDFQPQLEACISRREVLERSWIKMQIRGLINPHTPLPLITEHQVNSITHKKFFELAKRSRVNSTKEERRAYKQKQFVQYYSQIPETDMALIRSIYLNDFQVFEYDTKPRVLYPNG